MFLQHGNVAVKRIAMDIRAYEVLIRKLQNDVKDAMVVLQLGDSHQHACLKGQYIGLEQALLQYRTAKKVDMESDL